MLQDVLQSQSIEVVRPFGRHAASAAHPGVVLDDPVGGIDELLLQTTVHLLCGGALSGPRLAQQITQVLRNERQYGKVPQISEPNLGAVDVDRTGGKEARTCKWRTIIDFQIFCL